MSTATEKQMAALVEELRAGGYRGTESWLCSVSLADGTRYTAVRQLEVLATHVAATRLAEDISAEERPELARLCLLPKIRELDELIATAGTNKAHGHPQFETAWQGIERIIAALEHQNLSPPEWDALCLSLLIASMALRQGLEQEFKPSANDGLFASHSCNVHPDFLNDLICTLGWLPFDARSGVPLTDVLQRVADWDVRGQQ